MNNKIYLKQRISATAIIGGGRVSKVIIEQLFISRRFKSFETKLTSFPTFASLIEKEEREDTF